MPATIKVKFKNDFLLIEASGFIADLEEHKQFSIQCYDKIKFFGLTKVIIDISKLKVPKSLLIHNDLVEFFSDRFPEDIRYWTITIVTDNRGLAIGRYWEYIANQSGYWQYKAFASIEEAQRYIEDPDRLSTSALPFIDRSGCASKKSA